MERDIFWIKEAIENGDVKFSEGVGASDNPIMFRFEDDYIIQADNYLYMDDSLEVNKIDRQSAVEEIKMVCNDLLEDKDNKVVSIDRFLSLEARMLIDCLMVDNNIDFIKGTGYEIDCEHNFMREVA